MTEFVYSIASNVIDKIGTHAFQEICSAWGISEDMKKLELTMSIIEAVLLDAEEKQVKNRGLSVWLGQLKDVFHDATDLLDEFECEALRRQVAKTYGNTSNQVRDSIYYSSFNPLGFRYKMSHKIKGIRESWKELAKNRALFNLEWRSEDQNIVHREREMTHSFVTDSAVIGRDDDKENIIDFLMHPGNNSNVSVIFIVGIGGLGKTTLAQWVCNDERIATNFDPRIWVCVSEDFSVLKLAKEILKSAGGGSSENMSMEEVQKRLRRVLKEKRFFIVLDDVGNEDGDKWIELENFLIEGGQGSKILVTTRSQKVASNMAPRPIHDLKCLSDDDCLTLFLRCAFKEGERERYPKLVTIGGQIVKKCKGIPLAVKTLGSLLYSKIEERDWISIRDNEIWKQNENDILPAILRLCYNKLPSYLKQCFAYCSLYPKYFRYDKMHLIRCWMANGLLKKSDESTEEMEDIGEQYIKELLSRSFFQEIEEYNTIDWSFKMHNLLHDLSLYVAKNDYCLIEDTNNPNKFVKARHVSILDYKGGADATITFLHKLSNNMRTINFSVDYWGQNDSINESLVEICISRFKHLRLLNLSHSKMKTLSSSISTLKHLRYLNLSENTKIKKLPDSICDLQNLETLTLWGCLGLKELPRDMRKMVSLRDFQITTKQTHLPPNGIECMCSLRDLSFAKSHRLECFHEGIQCLTALRSLNFQACGGLISLPQGMKHLTALESLYICDCEELNFTEGDDYPTRLRQLIVMELPKLVSLPQGLRGFSQTLQFLHIKDCNELAVLPEWLPDLSSLRQLWIENCRQLSYLPEGMDRLIALRELMISYCPELERDYEREVFASFRLRIADNYRLYQEGRIASLP